MVQNFNRAKLLILSYKKFLHIFNNPSLKFFKNISVYINEPKRPYICISQFET